MTIINVLRPQDRMALILFSNDAKVAFNFIAIDEDGKAKMLK